MQKPTPAISHFPTTLIDGVQQYSPQTRQTIPEFPQYPSKVIPSEEIKILKVLLELFPIKSTFSNLDSVTALIENDSLLKVKFTLLKNMISSQKNNKVKEIFSELFNCINKGMQEGIMCGEAKSDENSLQQQEENGVPTQAAQSWISKIITDDLRVSNFLYLLAINILKL